MGGDIVKLLIDLLKFWLIFGLVGMIFSIPFDLHLNKHIKHKTHTHNKEEK